jgi:phage antirepressor YoqD-like protein
MTQIIPNSPDNAITMSSQEIAELLESRHDSVKRTMERLQKKALVTFTPMVETLKMPNGGEKNTTVYNVNKRDSYVVVAQLSPEFTARLVDRWMQLEQQAALAQFKVPTQLSSALRLAADQAETIEQQSAAIEEMKPKAEFHDEVAQAVNAQTFGDAAKVLGTGRNRLTQWMRERKILMQNNLPYQRFQDEGYLRPIKKKRRDPSTGEILTYTQTLVTGKGLTYLHKKWSEDHQVGAQ